MIHGGLRALAELPEDNVRDRSRVVRRLLRFLLPYRLAVMGAFGLVLVTGGVQAAGPYLIGRTIDGVIAQGDVRGLSLNVLVLAGVYLVGMISMRYQIYWMSWAGQKILADLRSAVMDKIHQLSVKHLESEEVGDVMSRIANDIEAINSFLSQGLVQTVGSLFAVTGIVIAMFLLNWQLALAALVVIPIMALTTGQFARMARRAFRVTRSTLGDVSADMQEELSSVKVAQAFNREDLNVSHFAERNAANRDANVNATAITSAFAPAMEVLGTVDTAIIAGYGGFLAVQGAVTVGVVVAFLQYVQNFFRPIQTVAQMWTAAQAAFAASERVFEILDISPELHDDPNAISLPEIHGYVVLENVVFGYDPEHPVLHGINLEARPGEIIALVGPTGAGKTTLAGLIMRLFDPIHGRVLVDGHDIRNVIQRSLRSQMGVVTQDPFLFSGTVMENIRYGRLDASDEEVIEAARIANAHDFIERLPDGYHTQVGERGGMLSLGQRQLIAISRAILADPRILILDEATASVDTRTEALIQQALRRLLARRTSIIIAHRLSTVRHADRVLVLDRGRIVERGTHEELIEKGGLYRELYRRQYFQDGDGIF